MVHTEKIYELTRCLFTQYSDVKALRALNKELYELAEGRMAETKDTTRKAFEEHLRKDHVSCSDLFTPLANILSASLFIKNLLAETPFLLGFCLEKLESWQDLADPQQLIRVMLQMAQTPTPDQSFYPKAKRRLYELMGCDTFPPDASFLSGTVYHLINSHLNLFEISLVEDCEFRQVCLIHGLLTALSRKPPDCFQFHLQELLPILISLCQRNRSHFHFFHKMKALDLWLTNWQQIRAESKLAELSLPDGPVFIILNSNWETPISGVPELVKTSMVLLLDCQTEAAGSKLLNMVLNSLSWRLKSKYLTLSVTIPYLSKQQILIHCLEIMDGLLQSLPVNHLASTGFDAYKVLLNHLSYEEFTNCAKDSFMKGLALDHTVALENCHHLWLPYTLSRYPNMWTWLMDTLQTPKTLPDHLSLITCLKVGRMKGLVTDETRLWALLCPALQHSDDHIRAAAFHCLAFAKKKSQPLTPEERTLTLNFLAFNLNVDSPSFRQSVMSSLKNLVLRVFETALSQLRSFDSPILNEAIMYVEQLHDIFHASLRPGANYQRRFISLEGLQLLFQFVYDPYIVSLSKGCTLAKREQLRHVAKAKGFWDFNNENQLPAWLVCLKDDVTDIRKKATKLVSTYFRPNLTYVESIFKQGWILCDSPKLQEYESGALLLHIAFVWAGQSNAFCESESKLERLMCLEPLHSHALFTRKLIDQLAAEFALLKTNFLQAASLAPVHGFLIAIRYHYELNDSTHCPDQREQEYLIELLDLCGNIVRYTLDCLSCKSDGKKDIAPSFEAIGDSVDEIIRQSTKESLPQRVSISAQQQQLVQSCAWLTLKEAAFLLARLGGILVNSPSRLKTTKQSLKLLAEILVRCRHKGVIETAGEACSALCQVVLSVPQDELREIPMDLLRDVLQRLQEQESGASITRRSAGLSFLVVKIVSSEPKKRQRPLVVMAVGQLMAIATKEIPSMCSMTMDLPSAQALHILQNLVHDSSLAPDLVPYMSQVLQFCIPMLSSPAWTVRNAALQLYGSLVPRLVGSKKEREDHLQPNTITVDEFFSKYPELHDFLLEQLDVHAATLTPQVKASLVPVLSLMAKLSPGLLPSGSVKKLAFKAVFHKLMGSPVIYVRTLAAQAMTALTSLPDLSQVLREYLELALDEQNSTNAMHGYLLVVRIIALRLQETNSKDWPELRQQIKRIEAIEKRHASYFIKVTVVDLFYKLGVEMDTSEWHSLLEDRTYMKTYEKKPGFPSWLRLKTKLILSKCPLSSLITTCEHGLAGKGLDPALAILQVLSTKLPKMSASSVIANSVMSFVTYYIKVGLIVDALPVCLEIVLCRGASCLSNDVYEWLPELCLKYLSKGKYGEIIASLALPVLALVMVEASNKPIFTRKREETLLDELAHHVNEFSQPEQSAILRMGAAKALLVIGRKIFAPCSNKESLEIKCELISHSVLRLLQDEDKDIRLRVASMFPGVPAPAHCLPLMVETFASTFVETDVIIFAWQILRPSEPPLRTWQRLLKRDEAYLFEEEPRNPFAEETRVYTEWGTFCTQMAKVLPAPSRKEIQVKLRLEIQLFQKEIAELLPCLKEWAREDIVWSPVGCTEGYCLFVKLKNRISLAEALLGEETFEGMNTVMKTWRLFDF